MKTLMILAVACFTSVTFAKGGSDTGGGNVCVSAIGEATLLELIGTTSHLKGDQLKSTKTMMKSGLDYLLDLPKSRAWKLAQDRLTALAAKSPKTSALIQQQLGRIAPLETPFVPEIAISADVDGVQCNGVVKAAAIYKLPALIFISLPLYNAMDLESQAGLFIHEALRQIQIYGNGDGTDRDLQTLTREIMSGHAGALDDSSFFSRLTYDADGSLDVNASRFLPENMMTMQLAEMVRVPVYLRQGARFDKETLAKYCSLVKRAIKYPLATDTDIQRLSNYGLETCE